MTVIRSVFIIIISTAIVTSCAKTHLTIENRKGALKLLLGKEVNITRDGRSSFVSFPYRDCKMNFEFLNENVQFVGNNILGCSEDSIQPSVIDSLKIRAKEILNFMKDLQISAVASSFTPKGIILKLYMRDSSVYLYCPDESKLVDDDYKKYIESAKKLDEGWYFRQKD